VYSSSQGCHTATGTHMPHGITPATRQSWHSRPYPSRSWYSIKRPRRDARLSWPSLCLMYAHSSRCCWSLSSIAIRHTVIDFAIFRFFVKLLQTNNKDIINDCCSFLILNCQVNVYIIAKPDLARHSVTFEIIVKCLWSKYCMWNVCLFHACFTIHGFISAQNMIAKKTE